MVEFPIPHIPPIRFVKSLISADVKNASVVVGFDMIPTLGMLVEAAAQSSSAILSEDSTVRIGFLVTLKNIKLLQKLKSTKYIVDVHLDHKLADFNSLSFTIIENDNVVATGSFAIALQ
ncbi:MAG: hypothetical protein J7L21_03365 [Sulfurimonas sp.]|nr:hypothetical protein [Sulfurimonas sp.]